VSVLKEFKEFIERGRVIDLAIAVVMGGAFNAIVSSAVKDIFMPVLSLLTMGTDFAALKITIGIGPDAAELTYGNFIAAVVNFLTVAIVIFVCMKAYNRFADKKIGETAPTKKCPYCTSSIAVEATRCPNCTSVLDEDDENAEDVIAMKNS